MAGKNPNKNRNAGGLDRKTRSMVNLTSNPVWKTFAVRPVSQETQITIGLAGRKALYALGHGQFEDFNELVVTAHAAIVLAENGYGADLLQDFNMALETILACRQRAIRGESYALDGSDGAVVSELLELHEQHLKLAGKSDLAAAVVEGYKRAKASAL